MRKEELDLALKKKTQDLWGFNGDAVKASKSSFSSLLTSKHRDFLLSPEGNQVKVSDLEGKVVGLYFAANWYPPCGQFTPILAGIYDQLRESGAQFEVVFVSSDEDSNAFNEYRATMPWLSIPFADLESKKALTGQFEIEGIPSLVVLQPGNDDGMAQRDGVELIYRFGVEAFPFSNQRLEELENEEREKHERQTIANLMKSQDRDYLLSHSSPQQVTVDSLAGKTVGLYFSAQWCPPCLKFTPKLISVYQKIKQTLAEGKEDEDFEIVLVSSDHDQAAFESYFATMPWLALPFGDQTIKELTRYFDIRAIPWLVILGPEGKTVTRHGRKLVNLYLDKAYPFTQAQLKSLEEQLDEEAKNLPKFEYHEGHHHELTLVSEGSGGGPFICCACDEQGSGWAYQCIDCGYEVHPKCVVKCVNRGSTS